MRALALRTRPMRERSAVNKKACTWRCWMSMITPTSTRWQPGACTPASIV